MELINNNQYIELHTLVQNLGWRRDSVLRLVKRLLTQKGGVTDYQVVTYKRKQSTGSINGVERFKEITDYKLTMKGVELICLSLKGEQGDAFRKAAIELFHQTAAAKLQDEVALSMNERAIVTLQNQFTTLQSRIVALENLDIDKRLDAASTAISTIEARVNKASEWAVEQMKKDAAIERQLVLIKKIAEAGPTNYEPRKNTLAQICKVIKMNLADAKKKLSVAHVDSKYFVTKTDKYGKYDEFTLEGVKWLKAYLKNSGLNSLVKKETPKWMDIAELAAELNIPQTAVIEYLYKKGVISSTKTLKITPFGMRNYYAKYFGETLIISPEFIAIIKKAF